MRKKDQATGFPYIVWPKKTKGPGRKNIGSRGVARRKRIRNRNLLRRGLLPRRRKQPKYIRLRRGDIYDEDC